MKYKILFDFGSEGFQFEKEEFDTVEKAVKQAIDLTKYYCSPFLIITIINWQAVFEEGRNE